MKTMKEYHDSYLKVDVFEKFKNNSLKYYELCPSQSISYT